MLGTAPSDVVDVAERVRSFASRLPASAEVVVVSGHQVLTLWAHELVAVLQPPVDTEIARLQSRLRTTLSYVGGFHEMEAERDELRRREEAVVAERDQLRAQLAETTTAIEKLSSAPMVPGDDYMLGLGEIATLTVERDALLVEVAQVREALLANEALLLSLREQIEADVVRFAGLEEKLRAAEATRAAEVPVQPPLEVREPLNVPEAFYAELNEQEDEHEAAPASDEAEAFDDEPSSEFVAAVGDVGDDEGEHEGSDSKLPTIQTRVYEYIAARGDEGATSAEVAEALGEKKHTIVARMHYLAAADRIVSTGNRGRARVFVTFSTYVSS